MTSDGGGTLGGGGAPRAGQPQRAQGGTAGTGQTTDAETRPPTPPAQPAQPQARPQLERLHFDPYDAPKSHHASRAFADMQAHARRGRRKKKIALVVASLVLGGALLWAVTSGLLHLLNP